MRNLQNTIVIIFLFYSCLFTYGQSWIQLGDAIPGEAAYDYSSRDVSISSDGLRIAIGAERNDGSGNNSGHARVFEYNSTNGWLQLGNDIDGQGAFDYFGTSVSLSSDGSVIAVGAKMNYGETPNTGYVQIYKYIQGNDWVQIGADIFGFLDMDKFGSSVSLNSDGTRIAIGATQRFGVHIGYVSVYDYDPSYGWVQIGNDIIGQAKFDEFGYSVNMNDDGSRIIVGAPYNSSNGDESGQVQVYELTNDNNWVQLGDDFLGLNMGDQLGYSVSINSNGSVIAIGLPENDDNGENNGQVQIYKYNSVDGWLQVGNSLNGLQYSRFGYAVSLDDMGNTLAVGAYLYSEIEPAAGSVEIYKYDESSGWTQFGQRIEGTINSQLLGQSVSLNSNGTSVVIGSQISGEVTLQRGETRIFSFDETADINMQKIRENVFYPNPTKGLVKINTQKTIRKIEVYNNIGQLLALNFGQPEIDISSLDRGIYFVKVFSKNGQIEIKKILKK